MNLRAVLTISSACFLANCGSNDPSTALDTRAGTAEWAQEAYVKASNPDNLDFFGYAVSLSSDGNTLAVGAEEEDSSATGINGNQDDESATASGAVYIFVRTAGTWAQQAYIKPSHDGHQFFGHAVSLSGDGNTLAVGAHEESSSGGTYSGAAYVFVRSGTTWSQEARLKASNNNEYDFFGHSVSLSSDGTTLAVGAIGEDSAATGVDGNETDNSLRSSGAVYVFVRSGSGWFQQAYVKASNTGEGDEFGTSVSLSNDGATLAVGAGSEDSSAAGIDGSQDDDSVLAAGAVYIFVRNGTTWSQEAYVKASNPGVGDEFGASLLLSGDGATLAVGARSEDGSAMGMNGGQDDDSSLGAGAVYVFVRDGASWSQQAYVKASNPGAGDQFGTSVSLSSDGATLAVGADGEDSLAVGVNGDQANDLARSSGAAYVYVRSGATWAQQAYVKASNTGEGDYFGVAVSLSADGATLAVGADSEDSYATGVDGNQDDDSGFATGASYVFSVQ
jgi:hypothetical protein